MTGVMESYDFAITSHINAKWIKQFFTTLIKGLWIFCQSENSLSISSAFVGTAISLLF